MNGAQTAAGAVGLGLVAADFWTSQQRPTITAGIFGTGASAADAHRQLKLVGAELLFVAVAVLVAGISDQAGKAMVAVLVALAVIWAINHYSKGSNG